jgi:hypothetical protein
MMKLVELQQQTISQQQQQLLQMGLQTSGGVGGTSGDGSGAGGTGGKGGAFT